MKTGIILFLLLAMCNAAMAKPPPWVPAHGYRAKHGGGYDAGLADELGITSGRCYAEKVGAVLGGVVGAAVGSEIGDGDGRKIAVIAGTILGVIIGRRIGRSIDEKDRYCTGQALEHGRSGQAISWTNPDTNYAYQVIPLNHYSQDGKPCRQFETLLTTPAGKEVRSVGDACREEQGVWHMSY